MFEEVNAVNDAQEQVVDAQTPEEVTSEVAQEAEGTPEATNAEPPAKVPQTQEENHQFAEMRRRHQAELAEERQKTAGFDRLMGVLQKHGYEGNAEQVADMIAAQQEGIPLEEYQARRAADQKRVDELLQKDPRYVAALNHAAEMTEKNNQHIRERDAAAINAAFPDANVTDPRELGPRFRAMMQAGVDPVDAYAVLKMADKAKATPTPPDIGPVNGGGSQDEEFFSDEELNGLSIDQLLKNPKLLEKANRSVTRLPRKGK